MSSGLLADLVGAGLPPRCRAPAHPVVAGTAPAPTAAAAQQSARCALHTCSSGQSDHLMCELSVVCKQHAAEAADHHTRCILQSRAGCAQRGAEAGLAAHRVPAHAAPAAQVAAGGAPLLQRLLLRAIPRLQSAHVQDLSGRCHTASSVQFSHMWCVYSLVDLKRALLSIKGQLYIHACLRLAECRTSKNSHSGADRLSTWRCPHEQHLS